MTNWARLARALDFYRSKGFVELDMPWHASRAVSAMTCPEPDRMYAFHDDVLVGSAEQSFMQAQRDGLLSAGRFVTLTPCFRNEPRITATHQRYFMKVELYEAGAPKGDVAMEFAALAREFMRGETDAHVDVIETDIGYDLEIGRVEVGSYSSRNIGGMQWTCGTGLAEPRFSVAVGRCGRDEGPGAGFSVERPRAAPLDFPGIV
jgi:hypothetical protein